MSSKFKRAGLAVFVPLILFAITACPGIIIDNIEITFDASGAIVGATGTFSCLSPVANNIVTYKWFFGDGNSAEGKTVSYQYSSAGDFIVECHIVTLNDVLIFKKKLQITGGTPTTPPPTTEPEIDIQRPASSSIADGGTDPQGSQSTFGNVTITYTVENTGTATLIITNITSTAESNSSIFLITPTNFSVSPGATGTFDVDYQVSADASFSFELDITSDDADESNYDILVSGTGFIPEAEINVERPSGSTILDTATDAQGNQSAGQGVTITYTIRNEGFLSLNITNITSSSASNVTVNSITPPSFTIIPGAFDTFDVTYTPTTGGAFSFELDITSNDSDEGNYDITVSGSATTEPEIDVQRPASSPISDGGTDAQGTQQSGISNTITYTVENTGNATLNVTNITSSSASNVTVNSITPTTLTVASGGGTDTFDVTYTPTTSGAFSFELDITSDDSNEGNYDITISGTGATAFLYVANRNDDTISVIDTSTNTVTSTFSVGNGPSDLFTSPDQAAVYATYQFDDELGIISTATDSETATVSVGTGVFPTKIAVTPDGLTAYVTNEIGDSVAVLDLVTNTLTTTISVGNQPNGIAITPDGSTAYVANLSENFLSVIDTDPGSATFNTVIDTIALTGSASPSRVAITPDGSTAIATHLNNSLISFIDTATNTVTTTLTPLQQAPRGIGITPDGTTAYVANDNEDTVTVIDIGTPSVTTTITVGGSPRSVVITPDGSRAYVSNFSDDTVSVIDTDPVSATFNTVIDTISVGEEPDGLALFLR